MLPVIRRVEAYAKRISADECLSEEVVVGWEPCGAGRAGG
jgi:hypothetical protein